MVAMHDVAYQRWLEVSSELMAEAADALRENNFARLRGACHEDLDAFHTLLKTAGIDYLGGRWRDLLSRLRAAASQDTGHIVTTDAGANIICFMPEGAGDSFMERFGETFSAFGVTTTRHHNGGPPSVRCDVGEYTPTLESDAE